MFSASLSRNVTDGLPRTTTPLLIHQQRSLASTPLLPSLSYLFLLLFCCLIQAIEKEEEEEEEELHLCAPPIIIQMREREREAIVLSLGRFGRMVFATTRQQRRWR